MTKGQVALVSSLALVLVLAGYGSWLLLFSRPGTAEIDAKRQPPQPLPAVSVQGLSEQLADVQVQGSLPINLEAAGLGRQDPFASR